MEDLLKWEGGEGGRKGRWLSPPYYFRVSSANPFFEHSMLVKDLVDDHQSKWKKGVLAYLFNLCDRGIILNIPLVPSLPKDQLVWHYSCHGDFSVKTAYHFDIECMER